MTKDQLIACQERINPYIHRTPVLSSSLINDVVGASVVFKCDNFQKMGAFKMRGALNAILQLSEDERAKGVVTHSSGNFAQAVALAAKSVGVTAYIVMPSSAPSVKVEAVKGYGGKVTMCEPTIEAREEGAKNIINQYGATFVHPSNDMNVIIGNSSACKELIEDYPDLDVVVTPVGGGGLLAGSSLAAHYFGTDCRVIAGEPMITDDAFRSLRDGVIRTDTNANTIADGLRTHLGDINFPIIQNYVDQIIRVEEEEIVQAMKLIWERMKIVVEPSSAVAFAAVIKEKEQFQDKQIGIIISGGNVDLKALPF